MSPELTKKLFEKYPRLYRGRTLPITKNLMAFGFECGDGWYNIISSLSHAIEDYVTSSRKIRARALVYNRALDRAIKGDMTSLWNWYKDPIKGCVTDDYSKKNAKRDVEEKALWFVHPKVDKVIAVQVKEKFGQLRFYVDNSDTHIEGMICMAEHMSSVTCEECGKPGKIGGKGWIRCLCDDCRGLK